MNLLFDHHLSPRLVGMLADVFSSALHVRDVALDRESDQIVWQYARQHGLTIVSKDSDFHQLSFVYGHPPKVVWLRCGSISTPQIADILRRHAQSITAFHADDDAAFLAIS
jgi:predicted nuclease of predicted toxin-antitoxin system